jgi:glycosyltransferase involved in cell wall biosynthesis
MKISIITPSYNQEKFLEQNIKSILSQKYDESLEHIIMDGGSSDKSINILQKYPHLIWRSEKDKGQAQALNKALKISTGDIIGWVNSDDMLPKGTLKIICEYFEKYNDHHVLVGNLEIIDEKSNYLYKIPAREVTYEGLLNGIECVTQTSTFFRKVVFEKIGNFNEMLHYCMDHEFFLRVAKYFKFYTIDADLGMFRRYAESKTGSNAMGFIKDRIKINRMHGGKVFSKSNAMIAYMVISEPFKKIKWMRKIIRRLKGANIDFIRYS